jgi:hypothetical protein
MLLVATINDSQQADSGLGNEVSRVFFCCVLVGKLNDGACRVGKWLQTAIIRARTKAVLGRSYVAYPRSVATVLSGTQVPAMVTQLPGRGARWGLLVTCNAPLRRFEKL